MMVAVTRVLYPCIGAFNGVVNQAVCLKISAAVKLFITVSLPLPLMVLKMCVIFNIIQIVLLQVICIIMHVQPRRINTGILARTIQLDISDVSRIINGITLKINGLLAPANPFLSVLAINSGVVCIGEGAVVLKARLVLLFPVFT